MSKVRNTRLRVLLSLPVFVFGLLIALLSVRADPDDKLPKELESAVKSYKSKELKDLIIKNIGDMNSDSGVTQKKATQFLLDLRNDELSAWVLTCNRTGLSIEALNEREVAVKDALFIARAITRCTLPDHALPGGDWDQGQSAMAIRLGWLFCKSLNQKAQQPKEFSKEALKKWALGIIEQALKKAKDDKKVQLRLELLQIEVKEM